MEQTFLNMLKFLLRLKQLFENEYGLLLKLYLFLTGTISTKLLHLVTMQHASFLLRKRALRGLRATITTSTSRSTFFSTKVNSINNSI